MSETFCSSNSTWYCWRFDSRWRYRPPNKSFPDFYKYIYHTLTKINNRSTVILGNFNLNIANINDLQAQEYVSIFHQYNYVHEIILLMLYVSATWCRINKFYTQVLSGVWENFWYRWIRRSMGTFLRSNSIESSSTLWDIRRIQHSYF